MCGSCSFELIFLVLVMSSNGWLSPTDLQQQAAHNGVNYGQWLRCFWLGIFWHFHLSVELVQLDNLAKPNFVKPCFNSLNHLSLWEHRMHEQFINEPHLLKKPGLDVMRSHPLCRTYSANTRQHWGDCESGTLFHAKNAVRWVALSCSRRSSSNIASAYTLHLDIVVCSVPADDNTLQCSSQNWSENSRILALLQSLSSADFIYSGTPL